MQVDLEPQMNKYNRESAPVSFTLFISVFYDQVVGHKKGLNVMERADPLFLLMGLPTIPVALVLGKMVRWEDYIMRLWHRYSYKRSFHAGTLMQLIAHWL